jgi:hypothetical protein
MPSNLATEGDIGASLIAFLSSQVSQFPDFLPEITSRPTLTPKAAPEYNRADVSSGDGNLAKVVFGQFLDLAP